jgi:acetoin utilization deacetylase AcuC-like enzyme
VASNSNLPVLDAFWHDDVLLHDTGSGLFEAAASPLLAIQIPHPEGPDRVRNMKSVLERSPSAGKIRWTIGRHADEAELQLFHTPDYIRGVRENACKSTRYTATTVLSPNSWPALLAAAGSTLEAARCVIDGSALPAFALVRPPGHHAAPAMPDGYCFFNNVALAAQYALNRGLRRVAIVDWDVHHGNGTQQGFYDRGDVLTVSMHMDHGAWGPSHPQSGGTEELGSGAGLNLNINVPLPMGSTDHTYLLAFDTIVAPRIRAFAPELLVVANGVDAGQFDPNGRQLVTCRGFHDMATRTRELAAELCNNRLLIVQEGGYNPAYAAFCVLAAVEGFAGLPQSLPDPLAYMPQFESRAVSDVASLRSVLDSIAPSPASARCEHMSGEVAH